jgi:hypothetical protein
MCADQKKCNMQTSFVKDVPKSFQWKILALIGHIWENSGYQTRQYVYKLGLIVVDHEVTF